MPNKVQAYVQKANEMSAGITRDPEAWMQFLHHSARFYKYTFNDQLLIYAQRPEATACASYDVWNNVMHRYRMSIMGFKGFAKIFQFKFRFMFCKVNWGVRTESWSRILSAPPCNRLVAFNLANDAVWENYPFQLPPGKDLRIN